MRTLIPSCCVTVLAVENLGTLQDIVWNLKLVYLNGNNAAKGENNIKYANSHPMN